MVDVKNMIANSGIEIFCCHVSIDVNESGTVYSVGTDGKIYSFAVGAKLNT
jgi:hypothetical protein